ncbi:MAG TPA: hypothetical protein PK364_08670 [Synergistaceae bacterium]|nr:hypothetical protein [Synergistaceae bacterium]HPJ25182.1 hypothetical protein [Synergistaceae bacterium]HPQ36746.1 hypothetical protein [Synergistaceae bacterium]
MSPLVLLSGMDYEGAFLQALFWTLFSESAALLGALFFLARITGGGKKKNPEDLPFSLWKILFAGFFASFATLPYLWFLLPWYLSSYALYAFVGEVLVILTEALFFRMYFSLSLSLSFLLSLWCNLFSLGVGKILSLF